MTIPISGDLIPPDPLSRKRAAAKADSAEAARRGDSSDSRQDRASILSPSPETIKGYVSSLKAMNPVNLHKVEELRERIRSGEYQADPDEMAGPLAELLSRERPGNRGA